ncbi:hypothetical protein ABPG77_000217 [Micractinium sp. CCAP 211/92]
MSKQGAKLTETFRQSRSDAARGPAGKKAVAAPAGPAAVAALNPQQQQQQQQEEADEAALRQFDLDSRFGPCTGVTRLQRWERAAKLGLDPPAEVPELVRRYGEGSDFNRNLFAPGKL